MASSDGLKRKAMTVNKLKKLVAALPEALDRLVVRIEGCDCTGIADGLAVEDSSVLITRLDRVEWQPRREIS